MRKIKFRAWWKEAKLMADVEVWRESDIVIIVPVVSSIPGHKFERQLLDEGQYELMQYTGLKDKNGKEIYEKDILKNEDYSETRIIEWENDVVPYCFDYYDSPEDWEIIGNVFENPNLLTN